MNSFIDSAYHGSTAQTYPATKKSITLSWQTFQLNEKNILITLQVIKSGRHTNVLFSLKFIVGGNPVCREDPIQALYH